MTGSMMFYGGIMGIVLGILMLLVCIRVFPKQRKKMQRELSED